MPIWGPTPTTVVVGNNLDAGINPNNSTPAASAEDTLAQAIYANDVETVNTLLAQGIDPNGKNSGGLTPLQAVASTSTGLYIGAGAGYHRALIKTLVDHGADLNLQDEAGNTPLIRAALCDYRGNIEDLLAAGANIEGQSSRGTTALLEATAAGLTGSVQVLTEGHANLSAKDSKGRTALQIAKRNGDDLTVQVLRRAGA